MKEAGAWNLIGDNVIQVLNPKGKVLYEFTEVEGGIYKSLRPGQPLTFLQNAAAAAPPPKTTAEMTGEWNVVRGASAPICALTLSLQPAGKDELSLKVGSGCDPAVLSFGPVSWHMEHGELVLKSARGPTWRFEEADGTWQRVPRGPTRSCWFGRNAAAVLRSGATANSRTRHLQARIVRWPAAPTSSPPEARAERMPP